MNWAQIMGVGLGVLRLSPDVFWTMTPREFRAALSGIVDSAASPMTRDGLDALAARFPDKDT